MRTCGGMLVLVLGLAGMGEIAAQERRDARSDRSHIHILTEGYPVPDSVRDPELRRTLEQLFQQQAGAGAKDLSPREREEFLKQLRAMLGQMPPGGVPDPQQLQGLEGYQDLLESYRRLLAAQQQPPPDDLQHTLNDWMRELAQDIGSEPGTSPFGDPDAGDLPPLLSPEGAKMMREWLGDAKLDPHLSDELKHTLAGAKEWAKGAREWFKDWGGKDPVVKSKWSKIEPDPVTPGGGPTGGGPTDPSGPGSGPRGGLSLPGLPSIADFPLREVLGWVVWAVGLAVAAYGLWLLLALLAPRLRAAWTAVHVPRPTLPPAFDRPEMFLDLYGPMMSWRLNRPLAGDTHRELARCDAAAHPDATALVESAADLYETLRYDSRADARVGELCARAHAVCHALLAPMPRGS